MHRYKTRKICGKRIDEHRRIMQEHLGRKLESHEVVHHINGDGRDNRVDNLQLMSRPQHTVLHSILANKTSQRRREAAIRGKSSAILTEGDIPEIRLLLAEGKTQKEIGKMFNVSCAAIGHIKRGTHWSYVS